MPQTLNIAFTIDADYIQHFSVALVSILENNAELTIRVFVLHDIENQTILLDVKEFFKLNYNNVIELIRVDGAFFKGYPCSSLYPKAIYYRLLAATIIPIDVKTLLYLDSDLVATGGLDDLLNFNFSGKYLFAGEDAINSNIPRLKSLGIPIDKYFNSGVLLLNLELWRTENITRNIISTLEKYKGDIILPDQDILNIFFLGKWSTLPETYNPQNLHTGDLPTTTPKIIHYMGGSKPWHYLNTHPYKSQYWKYLRLTPFKSFKAKGHRYEIVFRRQILWVKQFLFKMRAKSIKM